MKLELKKEVDSIFLSAKQVSGTYDEDQIFDVPDPARRYLKYALENNQRFISYARLKHGGQFKPSKKWTYIKGEEYFTVNPPGFVWFGKVRFVSAKDMYYHGSGRMQIKLLSLIKLVDAKGEEFNQGELMRWLSETPWVPTALLPSENLKWEPVDINSAKVFVSNHNITVEGSFFFNEMGQITKFTAKRYGDRRLQDWICRYNDYRDVEGIRVPFYVEASWNSESEDSKYAKFRIEKIEYDQPFKFE